VTKSIEKGWGGEAAKINKKCQRSGGEAHKKMNTGRGIQNKEGGRQETDASPSQEKVRPA